MHYSNLSTILLCSSDKIDSAIPDDNDRIGRNQIQNVHVLKATDLRKKQTARVSRKGLKARSVTTDILLSPPFVLNSWPSGLVSSELALVSIMVL